MHSFLLLISSLQNNSGLPVARIGSTRQSGRPSLVYCRICTKIFITFGSLTLNVIDNTVLDPLALALKLEIEPLPYLLL